MKCQKIHESNKPCMYMDNTSAWGIITSPKADVERQAKVAEFILSCLKNTEAEQ